MARIKRVWVFTVTANKDFACTSASLRLEIITANGSKVWDNLDTPWRNDRDRGQTDSYELVLSETEDVDDTQIQEIKMRIHGGHDAWFPASIWLLSQNVDGEIRLLSANPDWNEWFVTDSTPGYTLRLTPQQQAVNPSLIDADRL